MAQGVYWIHLAQDMVHFDRRPGISGLAKQLSDSQEGAPKL
jgi:hypothetical protein